jgi:hypothetical protein
VIWKRTNTMLSWSRSKTCLANEAGRAHDVIGHEVPHDPVLGVTLLDEWVFGIEREFEVFFFGDGGDESQSGMGVGSGGGTVVAKEAVVEGSRSSTMYTL